MPLSREEKLERLALLQEKKRRLRRAKAVYVPNAGQLAVHLDTKPIRLVTAGNGSGKSTFLVNEVYWRAKGYNPILDKFTKVPARIAVVLDQPIKVDDVFLNEIRKWHNIDEETEFSRRGKPYISEINFKNGSSINFLFHGMDALALEGVEFDCVYFDEPPPRAVWIGIMRGNRTKGSTFSATIIGTPIAEAWLYEELYQPAMRGEREDVGLHRFSTEVNRANLADGYIEAYTRNLTEEEKRIRLSGEFYHLSGLALAHLWKPELHVVPDFEWPKGKSVVVAIDPHPAKAHVALMCGATGDGRVYVVKEFKSKSPPRQLALELKDWYQGYRVMDIICDSLGNTPMSGGEGNRTFIEVLNAEGVPARATSYEDKSDEQWIENIRDVLEVPLKTDGFGRQLPKLAVFKSCMRTQHEIQTVQWLKYKGQDFHKPKLDITNQDFLACLKYCLATNIAYMATGIRPKIKRTGRSPWSARKET